MPRVKRERRAWNPFAPMKPTNPDGMMSRPIEGGVPSSTSGAGQSTISKTGRQAVSRGSILQNLMHNQTRPNTGTSTGDQLVSDFQDAGVAASTAESGLAADRQNTQVLQAQEQARQQAIQNNMSNERQQFASQARHAANQSSLLANLKQHRQNQQWNRKHFIFDNLVD
jgi:hypothetical protein